MILWDRNDLKMANSIKIILIRFSNNKSLECLQRASNLKHSNPLSGHSMTKLQLRSGSQKTVTVINSFQVAMMLHTAKTEIYSYICKLIDISDEKIKLSPLLYLPSLESFVLSKGTHHGVCSQFPAVPWKSNRMLCLNINFTQHQ